MDKDKKTVFIGISIFLVVGVLVSLVTSVRWPDAEDAACKEDLYQQAIAAEKTGNLQSSYRVYSYLCDEVNYAPANKQEHPCTGAARLTKRFDDGYKETMLALSSYRKSNGVYPSSLDAIFEQLSPTTREMAKKFGYCKKANSSDKAATCANGGSSFIDGDVSISTGQYGGISFDLKRRSNFSSPLTIKSCAMVEH